MKKYLSLLLLFNFFFIDSFCQGGIESGLVAKYCFSGNANDGLGARNATVHGATLTNDRFGRPNEAYAFNGIADYIQMPADVWVSGNFSFSGWIYVNKYGHWSRFFEWGNGIDRDNVFFTPCVSSTPTSSFTIHQCSSSSRTYANSPTGFPLSQWVHIVITLTGDTARIYKDNSLWYTYKMFYIPCSTVRTECYFGKSNFPADKSLDGKIDDVRIYNRVLSPAEVDTLFRLTDCNLISKSCDSTKRFAYAGKDTSICMSKTGNTTINLNASGGVSYKWSPTSYFPDPHKSSVSASITGNTDFVVEVTDSLGCKDKDTISIKLLPLPIITVSPNPISVCLGKSVSLTASGAAFYQWSPSINFSPSTGAKTSLTISPNETSFFVTGTDANGCSDVDTIRVNILDGPIVSALPKDTMGCYGIAIRLNAYGAQKYRWFPPVDFDNDTLKNPLLYISSNSQYIVEGTDSKGCKGYDTIAIKGLPLPVVKASIINRKNHCDSSIVELLATGANTYSWSPSIFCESPLSDRTLVKVAYDIVMKVEGKNEFGCSSEDTVYVRKEGDFKIRIPNAFTPNDDGINDKIRPIVFCNFTLKEFSIYNRWGQMVFSTNNLNKSWDGTFNGTPCSMDVYYYFIRGLDQNDQEVIDKGDITLVR